MKIDWQPTTSEHFDEMLGMLPPAVQTGKGFLVGEPITHRTCTVLGRTTPAFAAFIQWGNHYFRANEPMTIAEFNTGSRMGFNVTRSSAAGEQHD